MSLEANREGGASTLEATQANDASEPSWASVGVGRSGGLTLLAARTVGKGAAPAGAVGGAVLSAYTQSLLHRPLRDWVFGPQKGPRAGGLAQMPVGAVPKDEASMRRDAQLLNHHIRLAAELGKARGLLPPDYHYPHEITPDDFMRVVAEFDLAASPGDNSIAVQALLHPEHLDEERCTMPRVQAILAAAKKQGGGSRLEGRLEGPSRCAQIGRNQKSRRITLRFANLRTLLGPLRWLDSVVIDAAIHCQLEAWPLRHIAYVNSAETDISLAELRQTPECFKIVIIPLFYRSHWTFCVIDFVRKHITYANSQLLDRRTADFQTRPFRELFPDFEVQSETPAQQSDNSSCGVFSAFWSHCAFYWSRDEMDSVTQEQIYRYRERLLHQLLLSFLLLRHSH